VVVVGAELAQQHVKALGLGDKCRRTQQILDVVLVYYVRNTRSASVPHCAAHNSPSLQDSLHSAPGTTPAGEGGRDGSSGMVLLWKRA